MDLQSLLNVYKTRQGVPPILMNQTAPPEPEMKVTASRLPPLAPPVAVPTQPVAGQPNPNADIVVAKTGFADPLPPKEHKGIFGLKGTWRDIVGGIGDTLVMSKGGDPLYMQQKDREKIGDITANFANDPELTIQTLHQNGYTEVAAEYEKRLADAQASQVKADQWQSEFDLNSDEAAREKAAHENTVFGNGLVLMSSATDQASWARARTKMLGYWDKATQGAPLPFDIPVTYDPNFKTDLANFGAEGMFSVTKEQNDVNYNNQQIVTRREAIAAQQAAAAARLAVMQADQKRRDEDRDADRSARTARADKDRTSREGIAKANRDAKPQRRRKGGPPAVTPAKKK